jgi:hypothetical protein
MPLLTISNSVFTTQTCKREAKKNLNIFLNSDVPVDFKCVTHKFYVREASLKIREMKFVGAKWESL